MGKYMRKAKVTGEVAVMEVAQSTIGVRTRAKTLAIQRLQKTSTTESNETDNSGSSYFQLRSRRLEKPPLLVVTKDSSKKQQQQQQQQPKESCKKSPSSKLRTSPRFSVNSGSVSLSSCKNKEESKDEASFGENILEIEERDRSTRETTPCSLIRDSEIIRTPCSTTRPTNSTSTNRRIQNPARGNIPTTHEMEEFFAVAEQHQQRLFIEKYNFDPVNDLPLPGRYEWVRVDS
ncbi:Cyclin-dependent kinase inhibitor [Macleaya cordata]|uniref:Cyclin-dependent kinase inhibitor n=1 Tax=Macleaya cordata TaxID=56857 RepID=A0A200PTP9_MACCD|nr:Cyclin-dependent kinase inhibitor [Macleaya cordata]